MSKKELKELFQTLLKENPIQITLAVKENDEVYYCSLEENKYDLLILDGFRDCCYHEVQLEEMLNESDIHCYIILPKHNDKLASKYNALDLTLRRKFKGWKFENENHLYLICC